MTSPTHYDAYLFDLDGTLIDSAQSFWHILNRMRATENLPPLDFSIIRIATAQGANALIAASFDATENSPTFNEYKKIFLKSYRDYLLQQNSPMFSGVENIIQTLNANKIPWGIVTNKHEEFTQLVLKQNPLLSTALTVVSGDTVSHGKPHPAPLLHASAQLKIPARNIVFIGDHFYDIKAGREAGMSTGIALYGYIDSSASPKSWGADYFFKDADEIYQWLLKEIS